ncbi:unnamed protein product, partial [Closterium sp. NIES-54]
MHHITREGEASPEEEPWETSNKESAEGDGPNPELEVDDADGGHDNEEPGAGIEYAKPAQADTAKGASQEVAEGSRSGRWELRGSNADRQEVHDAERSRQQERQERDVGADAVGMQGERGRGKVELLRVTEEEARHWERAPGIPHSLDKRQTREGWVGDGTRLPERQLMRKGGWEGEPSIPNGYWRQEERRKEGPSSPGRHGQRQGERSGEALSSGPPEQWERRIGGGFRSPHARQQQSGEGGRDRHSPEGRRHQRRGEAWSPSPERQRQRKTSAAGWRDARVSLARLKARAEEWRGLRERRGDSSWNQQESKTGRGSLAYGAEQAREAREGPARFSGDQRAGPTLKNYLMQVGIVKYRCDRQGMDPIDFFLSLPNTLEGEAETLYRMRMDELLWRAGRYGEEPTEAFLERLQRQFPGHTAERIREFQGASLEEVFDLLERVELAQRKYEAYLPKPTERSRRPTWAAAMIPEGGGRTDGRGETGIDTRTCHRCGQPGHLQRDCKNCDGCGKPRHRKRECPDAAKCEICKKQGHKARDCYQREGGTRRQPEELQRQISRLQAQLRATGLRGEAEAGMYATDEDGEEVEQDVQSALMAWRGREEMGLRSRGKDGRQEQGRTEQAKGEKPAKPALEQVPACHPQEVLACHRRERRAYQAVGELLTGEQQAEEQGGIEGLMGGPRMRWMDEPKRHSDWQQPIHLVELFGGIGAGLSAVIRSGIAVRKWTYVEKEPVVRKMVEHHAWKLQAEFPDLLSGRVVQEAMGGAVHDVQHRKCFAFTMQELGRCKVKEMELKLSSTEPMFHRKRKMPHGDEEICKEKIKELEEVGLIRRSESKYATPTVVAARRDRTGEVLSRRMCGDYMALNKITIADRYPIPMAEEIFDKLAEGVFFMTLDLRQGNASAVFQRVMDSVLRGVECAACYIDDVVIFSTTKKQHLQDVERTLTAIEAAGLTCHPKKCRWGEQTVLYLGYEVKGWQIGIQQAKVEVLDRLREPKDKSGLRAVLGFLSYYRRFVPNFSKRATVLNGLLREDKAWEWGEAQKGARQDLMTAVKTAMLLKLPTADQPFTLYTDWRSQGMGGILCQEVEGEEKVVAYASRSCNLAEAQYSSYIGEGLAAAWAVGHFRVYLQGREFTLVTDHQPLTWLMTTPGLTGRNAR